jgi:fluoride ion exporter CrcB/FEX
MNMLIAIALSGGIGALGRHFLSSAVVAMLSIVALFAGLWLVRSL